MTLGKLAQGQQQYYLDTVAKGAEEYYTGAKEASGEWQGDAAARLGLAGEVDADALAAVLAHLHPVTGEMLSNGRSHPTLAGFDVTFSAPKSVSLLFALGPPEVCATPTTPQCGTHSPSSRTRHPSDAEAAAAL